MVRDFVNPFLKLADETTQVQKNDLQRYMDYVCSCRIYLLLPLLLICNNAQLCATKFKLLLEDKNKGIVYKSNQI